jgi:hypothetical protein
MNIKRYSRYSSLVAAAILTSSLTVHQQPAHADTWCGIWESNCKVDGIPGTSSSNPFTIKVRNSCNRDVVASIEYIPYDERDWHTSNATIRSGSARPVALTSNAIFYISSESTDGGLSWGRKEVRMRGTDYTYNLTCRNQ